MTYVKLLHNAHLPRCHSGNMDFVTNPPSTYIYISTGGGARGSEWEKMGCG
jgi:hypothetical protein